MRDTPMSALRVLSVGQCGIDDGKISRFLRGRFAAEVVSVDTCSEALESLGAGAFHLILVNRILDADGSGGTDVIRAIKSDPRFAPIATMLVSNYPDAQAEAIALGALRGFGKANISSPSTIVSIQHVFQSLIHS